MLSSHADLHRLVTLEEVVVDLHDDEAVGGQRGSGGGGQHVLAVTRRPGAEPRGGGERGEAEGGQGGLAEARPALAGLVEGLHLGRHRRGHEEGDLVVDLACGRSRAGRELAGDDERVLGHVGVDEGAVVVVGASGGGVRRVRRRAAHRDGGDVGPVGRGGAGRLRGTATMATRSPADSARAPATLRTAPGCWRVGTRTA